MSRQHHYLKTLSSFFIDLEHGWKRFEIRRNDRGFKVHDMVHFHEVDVHGNATGRVMAAVEIKYIMYGPAFGLKNGWCIFNW